MKTDIYTKTVLTVIAIALTINTLQDFDLVSKVYANEISPFEPMQVEIVSVDLKSSFNDPLPIKTDDYIMTDLRQIAGYDVAFNKILGESVLLTEDVEKYRKEGID